MTTGASGTEKSRGDVGSSTTNAPRGAVPVTDVRPASDAGNELAAGTGGDEAGGGVEQANVTTTAMHGVTNLKQRGMLIR
jgi:hypothetical protein